MPGNKKLQLAVAAIVGCGLLAQGAQAQNSPNSTNSNSTMSLTPTLTIAGVDDDNIFLTQEPAIGDRFMRYTPGLAFDYTADTMTLSALYRQDAEYYEDNPQLDSSAVRRTGTIDVNWQLSERFSFGLNGAYFRTPMPGDLNLGTGLLQLGRTPTTRKSVGATMDYAFSPTLDGSFSYTGTNDETVIGVGGDTHEGRFEFEKALSATNMLLFGYIYRQFQFDNTNDQDSHTAAVGWEHRFSPRTTFRILGGPRFFGDDVEPSVEMGLEHDFGTGSIAAAYNRGETLLAGSSVRVESQFASMAYTQRFGNNFTLSVAPAWGRVENPGGNTANVRQLGVEGRYSFNDYIAVSASWQGSDQEETGPGGFDSDIPRDVTIVALHLSYPIRRESP